MLSIDLLPINKHHNNIGSGVCVGVYFVQIAIERANWQGTQQNNGENQ